MNTERPLAHSIEEDEEPTPLFSEHFWGKDDAGYGALTNRMKQAKTTCQEILTMFQARASLEEDYGKKLLKLAKSPLGKDELGTLRESLDVVRYEIEAVGKSHIELASKIRDQLESALVDVMNSQKDKRKLHQASIDRTFRNKQLYLQQLIKAKEKYDAECLKTKGLSAAKMTLQGKELDKVSTKIEKTELASRAADVEYQQSIRQLTEINDKWISEWRAACDVFQGLEEQRIDYLRTTLWNYANIISTACVADDEVFIETSGTGTEVPEIPAYVKYHQHEGSDHGSEVGSMTGSVRGDPGYGSRPMTPAGPPSGQQQRSLPGPQLVESPGGLLTHSRRHSHFSSGGGELTTSRASPDRKQAVQPNTEVALAVGNNLFKVDSTLLQQADSSSVAKTSMQQRRASSPAAPIGYSSGLDMMPQLQYMQRQQQQQQQQHQQQQQQQQQLARPPGSVVDNVLGISLDATGTVKENRFPAWQESQPPLPPATTDSAYSQRQQHQQQHQHQTMAGRTSSPLYQIRSQTLPNNTNPTTLAGMDALSHRRSLSGIPVEKHTIHPGTNVRQITPDGKWILFYVRVLYDYDAMIPEELTLKEGDIIAVLHARDDGWWEGDLLDECNGYRRGLFPSNFTEPHS
ncbi:Proline-serine-threonine phosphatase-interacting protein 2 [Actinomortierella ambigua]|nr:Proline-serine-threonine phosphatase-interacting protein 2 [Actinomortierella ambigua]